MIFLGIDPGQTGAIGYMYERTLGERFYGVHDMPVLGNTLDAKGVHDLLIGLTDGWRAEDCFICIEEAITMPQQGARQRAVTAQNYGILIGVLACIRLSYSPVRPATWKRKLGLLRQDKYASVVKAIELFPTAPLTRKKDHGRAEALLLAWYARTTLYAREP